MRFNESYVQEKIFCLRRNMARGDARTVRLFLAQYEDTFGKEPDHKELSRVLTRARVFLDEMSKRGC